jgi:hypothetical protein
MNEIEQLKQQLDAETAARKEREHERDEARRFLRMVGFYGEDRGAEEVRAVMGELDALRAKLASVETERDAKQKHFETLCSDWAENDTEVKAISAKHGIQGDDGSGYFKSFVEMVEQMSALLSTAQRELSEARAQLAEAKEERDKLDGLLQRSLNDHGTRLKELEASAPVKLIAQAKTLLANEREIVRTLRADLQAKDDALREAKADSERLDWSLVHGAIYHRDWRGLIGDMLKSRADIDAAIAPKTDGGSEP